MHYLTPAAAPYPAFVTALRTFKRHSLPAAIDASALKKRFTAGVVRQLLSSFSALRLIDETGTPLNLLRDLVEAVDEPNWAAVVQRMLDGAYPQALLDSLSAATPAQLNQSLRATFDEVNENDRRQSINFLLGAARDAGLEISAYLTPPAGSRGKLYLGAPDSDETHQTEANKQAVLAARLIEKFPEFDPAWPDDLKEDWFEQFKELVALVKPEDLPK